MNTTAHMIAARAGSWRARLLRRARALAGLVAGIVLGLVLGGALLFAQSALAQPIWTASLLPAGGNVSAPAGATTGWGYDIANGDGVLWLVLTGVSADPFQHATPLSVFDLPILAPGASNATAFNGLAGLFGLTWDPSALDNFVNAGQFLLTAEWWSGDPLAGGAFVETAQEIALAYSATVQQQEPGELPVPGSAALLAAGALALAWSRRRARRSIP